MMRQRNTITIGLIVLALMGASLYAGTAVEVALKTQADMNAGTSPAWMTPQLPEKVQRDVENKAQKLIRGLRLDDQAKAKRVETLLAEHYGRVWAWHQQVDEKLDAAWKDWDAARDSSKGEKDELKALTVMVEQIDPIYAEFAPQIQATLKALRKEITEEQIIAILDSITRSPGVDRTYNAYCEMVPQMKDDEKQIIRQRLEQARVESLAAWSDKRIIKIFKKYKVRNEFSIDYFGYGYRASYKAWIKRGKK